MFINVSVPIIDSKKGKFLSLESCFFKLNDHKFVYNVFLSRLKNVHSRIKCFSSSLLLLWQIWQVLFSMGFFCGGRGGGEVYCMAAYFYSEEN